jgi:hypothetical protein
MTDQKKKKVTRSGRAKEIATAIHMQTKDGAEHVVGIGNLRVMVFNDDGSWFAQGLEIDYAAQGSSLEDVQRRFTRGLRETIDLHLKMYGNIEGVLRVAPPEVWGELYKSKRLLKHSQFDVYADDPAHLLPFEGIEYYGESLAA